MYRQWQLKYKKYALSTNLYKPRHVINFTEISDVYM